MNSHVAVQAVEPSATDEEIVAITSALRVLWPSQKQRRTNAVQLTWRFSGRRRTPKAPTTSF